MAKKKSPEQRKTTSQTSAKTKASAKKTVRKRSTKDAATESPQQDPEHFPIVGIGASAGGLAALKTFFAHVPDDSGLAYVVVVHLSPEHKSHLAELLQPHVKIPVQQVTETVALEPNHGYVIPPNANLDTIDTHLRLTELEKRRRERAPIDHFFRTLANTHDGKSIGVILTGTGSDGTLGLQEIKEVGGLCVVQDPAEAEYDGMPQSAIATGLVDFVLPVAEIPPAIFRFANTRPHVLVPREGEDLDQDVRRLLQKVFAQLRARTRRDFTRYKRATIIRRIERRMQLHQLEELADYVEKLRQEPEEVRALADDLLVTVTNFFRDREVFQTLERDVIPQLFEEKNANDEVRVWSVGCATGEEAYSLAMLLYEEAGRRETPPRLQVFASDLHERSLSKAREGFYPGDIETDVSPDRIKRYFQKENGGYRIRKEIREIVVFAPHNLLGDPPFSRLDLISCRNLLIYIQRDAQRDVIELFHYALRPDGILALGTSETLEARDLFRVDNKKCCIYQKRNVPGPEPRLPVFPLSHNHANDQAQGSEPPREPTAYGSLHQRMVERFAPPSALISPDDNVAHLSEHAGRYLIHPGGEPTTNVFKLVRQELRIELQAALQAARKRGEPTSTDPVVVQFNGESRPVVLHVRPALEPKQQGYVLVIFEERQAAALKQRQASPDAKSEEAGRVAELEAELDLTRQRLHSIIEEYETSQEEMKASNEEMQSTNEELRSTMEELETSKEELQSMNEELQTVNQENRHKVEELSQLSSDLHNLLAATDIATLFLDRDLRILRFTPRLGDLFNVRMTDRGRPIFELTRRLGYEQLEEDARQVLKRLVPVEREISGDDGRWYLTRVLPYRSEEDRIVGVVITFVDVSDFKRAEQELSVAKEYAENIVETLHEPLLVLHPDLTVKSCNQAFYDHFDVVPQETCSRKIYDLGDGQWNILSLRELLEDVLPTNKVFSEYEVSHEFEDIGHRVMLLNGRRLDHVQLILLGIRDITERKRAEDALRASEQRLQRMINVEGVGVIQFDNAGTLIDANDAFLKMTHFGRGEVERQALTWRSLTPPEFVEESERQMQQLLETGRIGPYEKEYFRKDGSRSWMLFAGASLGDGTIVEYCIDVADRKEVERTLQQLNESLETQVRQRTEMLSMVQDITRAANEADTVEEAMQAALSRISEYNGWQAGHVWRLADEGDEFVSAKIWHITEQAQQAIGGLEEFQHICEQTDFAFGQFPIGTVAQSGEPQWIDDIQTFADWRRGEAGDLGLHALIAFPVFVHDEVVAVLEFFSDRPAEREERFMEVMPDVGIQIGRVIERKRLERDIADAIEREQRRLRNDIHDSVGQELAGLRYLAQTHADSLAGQRSPDVDLARRITDGLATIQKGLRSIIQDLVPIELDSQGLASALNALAERVSTTRDVHCVFECDTREVDLESLRATHLYRIVQEAVSNALSHAEASQIIIRLSEEDDDVLLQVADDGVGIDPQRRERSGVGLRSMAYRADLVGGKLSVEQREEGGTVVRCAAPQRKFAE